MKNSREENSSIHIRKISNSGNESLPSNNSSIKKNLLFEPLSKSKSIISKNENDYSNSSLNKSDPKTLFNIKEDRRNSRIYTFMKRREILLNKFPNLNGWVENMRKEDFQKKLDKTQKIIFWIDMVSAITDIIIVTWSYYDHYNYIDSNYIISEASNINRIIFLFLSILICFSLVYRQFQQINLENLNYLLAKRDTGKIYLNLVPKNKIKKLLLILEILIHLIQPYPYLNYHWIIKILGYQVDYSLNMLFCFFGIFRIYMFIKVAKNVSFFTSTKSNQILNFFGDSIEEVFLYRSTIKYSSFLSLILYFFIVLYLASLMFKIFEKFDIIQTGFYYMTNCVWYFTQTMATSTTL